jgi:hypothetical protein
MSRLARVRHVRGQGRPCRSGGGQPERIARLRERQAWMQALQQVVPPVVGSRCNSKGSAGDPGVGAPAAWPGRWELSQGYAGDVVGSGVGELRWTQEFGQRAKVSSALE